MKKKYRNSNPWVWKLNTAIQDKMEYETFSKIEVYGWMQTWFTNLNIVHIENSKMQMCYCCKLSENFHCCESDGLQTSTVSPPVLVFRLSRHKLLPTCLSFELLSICSHFWRLSLSRQPCSFMREPADRTTTVRHKSMCFTDLSFVSAHSWFPPALWHS